LKKRDLPTKSQRASAPSGRKISLFKPKNRPLEKEEKTVVGNLLLEIFTFLFVRIKKIFYR